MEVVRCFLDQLGRFSEAGLTPGEQCSLKQAPRLKWQAASYTEMYMVFPQLVFRKQ